MLLSAEDSSAITHQLLELCSWYENSTILSRPARDDCLQYTSLPDCFPQGPLRAKQLVPPPGYAPLQLTLSNCPEALFIGHISQRVSLDEDQVAAMFVGAKRAGLYPHSITTGLGTAQEVSQWALLHLTPPTDPAELLLCVCECMCVCV